MQWYFGSWRLQMRKLDLQSLTVQTIFYFPKLSLKYEKARKMLINYLNILNERWIWSRFYVNQELNTENNSDTKHDTLSEIWCSGLGVHIWRSSSPDVAMYNLIDTLDVSEVSGMSLGRETNLWFNLRYLRRFGSVRYVFRM